MEDVRQQILNEVENPTDDQKSITKVQRPLTADSLQPRSSPPKKFKMLKELARLNQELRVQKPYHPTPEERKRLEEDRSQSAHSRSGKSFLKRGGGIGGGNMPTMDDAVKSSIPTTFK